MARPSTGIRFSKHLNDLVARLERLGATVVCENQNAIRRPASLRILTGEGYTDCILSLWTITPGGGAGGERPANERRIQITNAPEFSLVPGCTTLVGGWSEEIGVYAFWDPRRHTRFSKKSPSLQVALDTLERAHAVGIATQHRPSAQGSEVVVAVSEDSLLWYIQHGAALHNSDEDTLGVIDLIKPEPEEERDFIDSSEDAVQAGRRYELVQTMRAFRDARFRPDVLRAYRYCCAVCGYALKLVDAAHIVPVSYPESTDEVTNGIALCRLHHGAYDGGLLGVRSDYGIVTNAESEEALRAINLDMGLESFKSLLPKRISVPTESEIRPDPKKLKLGMQARNWPREYVA